MYSSEGKEVRKRSPAGAINLAARRDPDAGNRSRNPMEMQLKGALALARRASARSAHISKHGLEESERKSEFMRRRAA